MFFNSCTTAEKPTGPRKHSRLETHSLWRQKSAFWAVAALTTTVVATLGWATSVSASPSDTNLALLAQLVGVPSKAASSPGSSSSTSMTPAAQNTFRKPPSERDPRDLEALRAKEKVRIVVGTRRRVRNGEILSGDAGENEVRPDATLEIEGGQLFIEGADLENNGRIIVRGPREGTLNPRKGELILRSAALTGTGSIDVQNGGRLCIEGTGRSAVRGLDIIIQNGGELLMEGDDIELDEFASPTNHITNRGSIRNLGTIRLRGKTRIQPGAHDIHNMEGGAIILEAGDLEANKINNWPGAQITIESSGEVTPNSSSEYTKHLKRALIRNYGTGADNRRGRLIWKSKTIDIGGPGSPIITGSNPQAAQGATDADIQAFVSNVVILNQGDLLLEQRLTKEELEKGPPTKTTTGARVENVAGGIIQGGGLLHGTILNNGGTLGEPPYGEVGPLAEPSFTMRQVTGNLSLSSGLYEVSINSANYGQYWISGSISVGPSTCKVTTTCATGFPVANYAYPVLKSNTGIVDYNTSAKIGFETYQSVRYGSTACTINWVGPSDTTFLCPNAAPVSTGNLAAPPRCFVIKVNSVTFP